MQVVGFNLSKISAHRMEKKVNVKPSMSISFTDLEKDKADILKDSEILNIKFEHSVDYEHPDKKDDKDTKAKGSKDAKDAKDAKDSKDDSKLGAVNFEGNILLSVSKEESKNISKAWKKKQLPQEMHFFLSNIVLRRCTPKAVSLQDEIGLPIQVPMPRITPQPKE